LEKCQVDKVVEWSFGRSLKWHLGDIVGKMASGENGRLVKKHGTSQNHFEKINIFDDISVAGFSQRKTFFERTAR
jgi:hypothetical protein